MLVDAAIALGVGLSIGGVYQFLKYKAAKSEEHEEEMRKEKNLDYAGKLISKAVEAHIETLLRKRRTLIRRGDYGEVIDGEWKKEIAKFVDATIPEDIYSYLEIPRKNARQIIIDQVDREVQEWEVGGTVDESSQDLSSVDGVEYEVACAEILQEAGWDVRRTQATNDNGIDLIAEKPGRRVAIQCKRHRTPVGNSAVQEAYSGMVFAEADEAVVVSTAPFTAAAKTLANKLSVGLVHHEELDAL